MATQWNISDYIGMTFSEANSKVTATTNSTWASSARANKGVVVESSVKYFEYEISDQNFSMVGLAKSTAALSSLYAQTNTLFYYSSNGSKYVNGATSAYGSSYTAGDRLSCCIKNGSAYFRKIGTWQNSSNPDTNTNPMVTGLTGTYYPACNLYTLSSWCKLYMLPGDWLYSVPSGATPFDTEVSVTVTLVDAGNSPIASTSVNWAFFENATVQSLVAPIASGTASTNGAGELVILFYSDLAPGTTGSLLVSTTSGSPSDPCLSHYAPINID